MDALGKFGEHEKCVRVAGGAAESNSFFLSAVQTSLVYPAYRVFSQPPVCLHQAM